MNATGRLAGLIDEVLENYFFPSFWHKDIDADGNQNLVTRADVAREIAEHIECALRLDKKKDQ